MNNQRFSQSANRSSSSNYRQWSLDEYDEEPAPSSPPPRSPPSRPPPARRAPSLNVSPPEPPQMGSRFAGTSWLGHMPESHVTSASPSPSHCDQENLNAWDMTDQYNSAYYTTGLWDQACLNPPYCLDSIAFGYLDISLK